MCIALSFFLVALVVYWICKCKPKQEAGSVTFVIVDPKTCKVLHITSPRGDQTMAFIMRADQKVNITVAYTDSQGNPATTEGVPVWGSSDASVTVEAASDGLSAVATASGIVGTAQVNVTADADLGEGVKEIVGTLDIEIVGGEAVSVVLTPGTPEPK